MKTWEGFLEDIGVWEAFFSRSPTAEFLPKEWDRPYWNSNAAIVGVLTLVWFGFFGLHHLVWRHRSWKVKNLMVSFWHSILCLLLCIWALGKDTHIFASPNTPYSSLTLQVSFSYFLYDHIVSEFLGVQDLPTALHHLISLSSLGIGLWTRHSASELLYALLFMESSNPCLHARGILRETSPTSSGLLRLLELLFVVVYFFARIVYGPYLCYNLWMSNTPFLMKIAGGLLVTLSFYWFFVIVNVLVFKKKRRSE